ncbi:hypothetical protein [Verrucomicrobium spinosum]|nr:hypothetical protein [Verrucomicrobium spinosum]
MMSVEFPAAMKWLRKLHPGPWKKNACANSYDTCRTAQTQDMPRVALKMGNSVVMIKKHSFEAKSRTGGGV